MLHKHREDNKLMDLVVVKHNQQEYKLLHLLNNINVNIIDNDYINIYSIILFYIMLFYVRS